MRDVDPHLIYDSLGQSKPTTQMASPSVQPFLHRWCRVSLYFTHGRPSHSKLPLPMRESGPPSSTWFPEPIWVLNPNGISIGSAIFAGLTSVIDQLTDWPRPTEPPTLQQTDRPCYLVGNNRPPQCTWYVWCGPNNRCSLLITRLEQVEALADISQSALYCHSNESRTPIANLPNQ